MHIALRTVTLGQAFKKDYSRLTSTRSIGCVCVMCVICVCVGGGAIYIFIFRNLGPIDENQQRCFQPPLSYHADE
jgi:hypothetical protein